VLLVLTEPPARVRVGERVGLTIEGRLNGARVSPGALAWRSTDPTVATVSPTGEVLGVAPGVTYVTVSGGRSEAMLEIEVVPPP
jgi:uncharacterized protein YjdB